MAKTAGDVAAFFRSREDSLSAATVGGIKRAGRELAKEANRQLRQNFKARAGRAKAKFYRARGTLPDASIISIRPSFLLLFEEGAEIRGDRYLVIPIAPFKRVGGAGWAANFRALKQRGAVAILPTKNGYLVTLNGQGAYSLVKQVTIPDRLNIREAAEAEADRITGYIDELIDG